MTINFEKTLPVALKEIFFTEQYHELLIFPDEQERDLHSSCAMISKYGERKWQIVDLVNQRFNTNFDLYNWLHHNPEDELAYFLNEAGSNCLNHSQFKVPYKFHLWLGEKGFVVALEQLGKGFNAQEVDDLGIKENEGAAFNFFRKCKNEIFFDDCHHARIVYLKYLF